MTYTKSRIRLYIKRVNYENGTNISVSFKHKKPELIFNDGTKFYPMSASAERYKVKELINVYLAGIRYEQQRRQKQETPF